MVPEQEMCPLLSHRLLHQVSFRENELLYHKNCIYILVNDFIIGFTSTVARKINDWSFNISVEVNLVYAYCMNTILAIDMTSSYITDCFRKCCVEMLSIVLLLKHVTAPPVSMLLVS